MSQVDPVLIYDESACLADENDPEACPDEAVFIFNHHCPKLVGNKPVVFDVVAGNWGISHIGAKGTPGHVYIVTRNVEIIEPELLPQYSNADFDFDLHGDVDPGVLFPPNDEYPQSRFQLTEYKLWAGVGGKEKYPCNSDGRRCFETRLRSPLSS